jgi:hypothetical protein
LNEAREKTENIIDKEQEENILPYQGEVWNSKKEIWI